MPVIDVKQRLLLQRPAMSVVEVTIEGDPDDVTSARCDLLRESQKVAPCGMHDSHQEVSHYGLDNAWVVS